MLHQNVVQTVSLPACAGRAACLQKQNSKNQLLDLN